MSKFSVVRPRLLLELHSSRAAGKLELPGLREDSQAQGGAAYSRRRFNDVVPGHGQPTARFLRAILLKDLAQASAVL